MNCVNLSDNELYCITCNSNTRIYNDDIGSIVCELCGNIDNNSSLNSNNNNDNNNNSLLTNNYQYNSLQNTQYYNSKTNSLGIGELYSSNYNNANRSIILKNKAIKYIYKLCVQLHINNNTIIQQIFLYLDKYCNGIYTNSKYFELVCSVMIYIILRINNQTNNNSITLQQIANLVQIDHNYLAKLYNKIKTKLKLQVPHYQTNSFLLQYIDNLQYYLTNNNVIVTGNIIEFMKIIRNECDALLTLAKNNLLQEGRQLSQLNAAIISLILKAHNIKLKEKEFEAICPDINNNTMRLREREILTIFQPLLTKLGFTSKKGNNIIGLLELERQHLQFCIENLKLFISMQTTMNNTQNISKDASDITNTPNSVLYVNTPDLTNADDSDTAIPALVQQSSQSSISSIQSATSSISSASTPNNTANTYHNVAPPSFQKLQQTRLNRIKLIQSIISSINSTNNTMMSIDLRGVPLLEWQLATTSVNSSNTSSVVTDAVTSMISELLLSNKCAIHQLIDATFSQLQCLLSDITAKRDDGNRINITNDSNLESIELNEGDIDENELLEYIRPENEAALFADLYDNQVKPHATNIVDKPAKVSIKRNQSETSNTDSSDTNKNHIKRHRSSKINDTPSMPSQLDFDN